MAVFKSGEAAEKAYFVVPHRFPFGSFVLAGETMESLAADS